MPSVLDLQSCVVDVWNRRDWKALRELLHCDYRYIGPFMKEVVGPEEGVKAAQMYVDAFPDGRLEIKDTYVFENMAIAELRTTGTHLGPLLGIPPTGRRAELEVCNIIDMRDDKVYRAREYMDMFGFMTQLGVLGSPMQSLGSRWR